MKRKSILMVVLVLAIVTALSAGTLAIYTSSVDLAANEVTAKKFYIGASGDTDTASITHSLAPTEQSDYKFSVTNNDGNSVAEVPIDVTIALNAKQNLFTSMPGLKIELIDSTGKIVKTWNAEDSVSNYEYKNMFLANVKGTVDYIVRTTWFDDGRNTAQTAAQGTQNVAAFQIKVTGTQHTGA